MVSVLMPSSSRTHRAPAASAAGEVALLHTIWRHFFSDGVVARVWECGDYARNTPEGLLRCARQELRGNGAATVLRWDLPVAIFKSVTMLPTEDELVHRWGAGTRVPPRPPRPPLPLPRR